MSETMLFNFEFPIKFKRIFNFTNPELILNNYWFETKNIEQFKPNIKQTLVKSLKISLVFKGKPDKEKYLVTLIGVTDPKDVFYVTVPLLPNFLKEFDLL